MLGKYLNNPELIIGKLPNGLKDIYREEKNKSSHIESHIIWRSVYSNSYLMGCQDTKKSTPGYAYLLAGGVVYWKSTKQSLIASFTMIVEFIACYEATKLAT